MMMPQNMMMQPNMMMPQNMFYPYQYYQDPNTMIQPIPQNDTNQLVNIQETIINPETINKLIDKTVKNM
jgi:hypothetical protein